jgi:4-hydroxy-3-polyprenylbenzoate decarboxylase
MGFDATTKIGSETNRDWGRVAKMDAATLEKIEQIAKTLGL